MPYTSDEYDENDDVRDLNPIPLSTSHSTRNTGERLVRRRSSKACDGCRKAKCKCERTPEAIANADPCRNCVLLGQECTFLGPSRKRGPPKGYIDALESKLHQMEALLGTIITSDDVRARSLIFDLSQDPLAREIIQRVDETPFGTRGRKQAAANRELYGRPGGLGVSNKRRESAGVARGSSADGEPRFGFSGPPHEWQDGLTDLINSRPYDRIQTNGSSSSLHLSDSIPSLAGPAPSLISGGTDSPQSGFSNGLSLDESKPGVYTNYTSDSVNPYQRRRIDAPSSPPLNLITARGLGNPLPLINSSSNSSFRPCISSQARSTGSLAVGYAGSQSNTPPLMQYRGSPYCDGDSDSDASELADAAGQLSINDLQQVRYHGKASGLHLLIQAMDDADEAGSENQVARPREKRVKGGIWEFPPAGVWPPAPKKTIARSANALAELRRIGNDDRIDAWGAEYLPDRSKQEHLVGLYFNYVHPVLPVLHRKQFFRDFEIRNDPNHPNNAQAISRTPNVLLLAMYSIAARYANDTPLPPHGQMWTAGDEYFDRARELLVNFTSLSRLEYVQAMLLMGYREIGLGTMAQAWLYLGLAIKSAQDVGLHRSIAKWQRTGSGRFTQEEKETRARIWHCAIRLDRYVSTYIGRPLTVYEHDYDTQLPEEDPEEENDLWSEYPTFAAGIEQIENLKVSATPQPARVISCFKQSITLSKLLGGIVRNLYAIRAPSSTARYRERDLIEQKLDKWLLDLPEHFRCENPIKPTSPNVLTLHMQYWCTVLLLNRPFIRSQEPNSSSSGSSSSGESDDVAAITSKALGTCQNAANHITNIASAFTDAFCIRRAPAIFTYYIFTASIMHVTSLLANSADIQASLGLQKTMTILKNLSVVWPSARRAWDLLDVVNVDARRSELALLANAPERKKRSAIDTELSRESLESLSRRTEQVPTTAFGKPSSGGQRLDPSLNLNSLPPIQPVHIPSLAAVNTGYSKRSPPQNHSASSFSDPTSVVHSSFNPPVSSFESWGSQSAHHPARQSLGHSPSSQLSSHTISSSSSYQPHSVSEPNYTYASTPQITLPPLSSYTQSLAGSTLPSQSSPFPDHFSPSPVPPDNQRFSSTGSGYWGGFQSSDPFGDPSLLSSYAPAVQPTSAPGFDGSGPHAVIQGALQEPLTPHLHTGYSAINNYFSDTSSPGVYFGSGSRQT